MTNLSRTNAVRNYCRECAGPDGGNRSVSLCTAYGCFMFPFRNGTPKKTEAEKHLQARADMNERNRLMRQRAKEKATTKLSNRHRGSGQRRATRSVSQSLQR